MSSVCYCYKKGSQEPIVIWLFGLHQILIQKEFQKFTIKTLCNNEITNKLFYKKLHFIFDFINYRTHAIITRGLYIFYSQFEVHLCTVTFCLMYG